MEQINYEADVKKIKAMIADYRVRTPPKVKGGIETEYNSATILLLVVLSLMWMQFLYFQNIASLIFPMILTFGCVVGLFINPAALAIYTKRKISPVWERDYITDEDMKEVATCSESFKQFLLESTHNDITNLTYNRIESIVNKYNSKCEQKARTEKNAQLSRERLNISSGS
ncbi:TPA: hypothetical protein MM158_004807 [Klebsiella pneumoniae]|nr:hypothetical protein [Klebsiella pneumoniae]